MSRELVYRRPNGETITEYIDSNQWVYTTKSLLRMRILRQTHHAYTAQVTWIDAHGNRHVDPKINLWHASVPQQFSDRRKRALIGQKITPSLIAGILKLHMQNARVSYGIYCGRKVLIAEYDSVQSYYDMKTGIELIRYRQGVVDLILQTGQWTLRKGRERGVYEIICH